MCEAKKIVEELRNKKSRDNRELLDRSADMIERLAKELCEKSGCHHKCNDTTDCVVEDEALLLINENKSNNFDVKSNNFDVKSNEELFKQALVEGVNRHFDKTIEEAKKIEQIEEMALLMAKNVISDCILPKTCARCKVKETCLIYEMAERLYNAGYRKQSEGEWTYDYTGEELLGTDAVYQYKCSLCGEHSIVPWRYCPDCGAKMKGGEE